MVLGRLSVIASGRPSGNAVDRMARHAELIPRRGAGGGHEKARPCVAARGKAPVEGEVTLSPGTVPVMRLLGSVGRFVVFLLALCLALMVVAVAFPFLLIFAVLGFLFGIAG